MSSVSTLLQPGLRTVEAGAAERQLRTLGITVFATPTDPGAHRFYRWMRVGFSIFTAISDIYPRYRTGSVHGTALEVFPEASADLLAGRLRGRYEHKREFRRRVLADHGIDTRSLTTIDAVDAALAALTGVLALQGIFSSIGDPDEGVIVVPVASLPIRPLRRSITDHSTGPSASRRPTDPLTVDDLRMRLPSNRTTAIPSCHPTSRRSKAQDDRHKRFDRSGASATYELCGSNYDSRS